MSETGKQLQTTTGKNGYGYRQCLLAAIAGWIVLALLCWPGFYLTASAKIPDLATDTALGWALLGSLAWGVTGWLVLMCSRELWGRPLSVKIWAISQLLLGMVLVLAMLALIYGFQWRVSGLADLLSVANFSQMLLVGWPRGLAIYAGVWAVCQAWLFSRRCRYLERRLVGAELHRLRTQLNPHFLFNALNAISELGYKDPSRADRTITQLSSLLRKSLDDSHQQEIALRNELEFLNRYFEIQQTLLEGRLQIEMRVPDNLLNARVPGMILQPLVENAVIHGMASNGKGWLRVQAARDNEMLILEVEDNGWGLVNTGSNREREGIGIANTRARLRFLYGELANLELMSRPGEGMTVRLSLPFHEAYAYNEVAYPDR